MKLIWFVTVVGVSIATFGCGGGAGNATNNANAGATRPASSPAAADSPASMSLATPTDAYKAAYEYRKTKNIEGLKKVMSKDVLEFLTEIGKADKKSLDDMLREMCEKPQAPTNETRNLKVNGEKATLQYLDEDGKDWMTMDFIKEGNEWKMTIPKAADGDDLEVSPKKP